LARFLLRHGVELALNCFLWQLLAEATDWRLISTKWVLAFFLAVNLVPLLSRADIGSSSVTECTSDDHRLGSFFTIHFIVEELPPRLRWRLFRTINKTRTHSVSTGRQRDFENQRAIFYFCTYRPEILHTPTGRQYAKFDRSEF